MPENEVLRTDTSWIEKTPDVCGGRACLRTSRLPVWSLVYARRLGFSDAELLNRYGVTLTPIDLEVAWAYYDQNRAEIEHDIRQNTEQA
jgi:uncharacterized protein (DUF433 family)